MWHSVFALLITAAAASDDDSNALMQNAVGLAHQASAQEFSSAIHSIGENLNAANIPGKARQLAINAMMRSVAGAEKLDDDTKAILQNITTLLNDILTQMESQMTADQAQIDAVHDAIAFCNDEGVTEDGNLETASTTAANTHKACRDEQVTLFDDDAAKCLIMTNYLMIVGTVNCNKPQPVQDAIVQWDTLFTSGYNWFKETKEGFEPKRDDCVAAEAALTQKNSDCNELQNGYENHFCEWHLHRVDMCDQLDVCYDTAVEAHTNTTDRIRPLSEQRVKEAGVIEHIVCLINNLISGETDRALCVNAINEDANQLKYGNRFPDPLDPKATCNKGPVSIHPGSTGWYDFAYVNVSTKTPADELTGVTCQ